MTILLLFLGPLGQNAVLCRRGDESLVDYEKAERVPRGRFVGGGGSGRARTTL